MGILKDIFTANEIFIGAIMFENKQKEKGGSGHKTNT